MTGNYWNYWTRGAGTSYVVSYNHRGPQSAGSRYEALLMVQAEAGQPHMAQVDTSDGLFCYRTPAEAEMDPTGAKAYAVIREFRG